MVQSLHPSTRAPTLNFELKTWQKVAFIVSGLISIALISTAIGVSRTSLPQTIFYAAGGGLGGMTLLVFFVVKCVKRLQNTASSQPANPPSSQKVEPTVPLSSQSTAPSQPAHPPSSQKVEPTFSLFAAKEKDLTVEIEKVKNEVFKWIETLDLPDETIEKTAWGYSHKYGWDFPYTKKELREDFELTASKKRSQKEILCHLRKMQEALPYHLGLKKDPFSSFSTKGFPNVGGNNCFFNAALQAVVHSRCVDYALLRPFFRAPDPLEPDPGYPVEPIPEDFPSAPQVSMWNSNPKKSWKEYDAECEQITKKYDEEYKQIRQKNEEKRNAYNQHCWKKKEWDEKKATGLQETERFEKQFHSLNSGHPSQEQLLQFVEKLRGGTSLTAKEVTAFFNEHGMSIGRQGWVDFVISIINQFVPSNYHLTIKGYTFDQTKNLLSCPYTPIIILNGKGHVKVYVRTKDEDAYHAEIDDATVIKKERSSKSFSEGDSYRIWQPQFLSLKSA